MADMSWLIAERSPKGPPPAPKIKKYRKAGERFYDILRDEWVVAKGGEEA